MSDVKLMKPLFYNGMYNSDGRKMRAIFEKEVSNGENTYRLWRKAGNPDVDYPVAENDRYLLYLELNGYLAPLKITEFRLIDQCGFYEAVKNLYGGADQRGKYFEKCRENKIDGNKLVTEALEREEVEVQRYGSMPERQANFIKKWIDGHVAIFQDVKAKGGDSFPDFVGGLALNDLTSCVELYAAFQEKFRKAEKERRDDVRKKERCFVENKNKEAEEMISAALRTIKEGGVLENDTVSFYRNRYECSAYSIFNYLMRRYNVTVPLQTQGWINKKLVSATIENGRCEHLQYKRSKGAGCSQKFFDCMNDLIAAVNADDQYSTTGTKSHEKS